MTMTIFSSYFLSPLRLSTSSSHNNKILIVMSSFFTDTTSECGDLHIIPNISCPHAVHLNLKDTVCDLWMTPKNSCTIKRQVCDCWFHCLPQFTRTHLCILYIVCNRKRRRMLIIAAANNDCHPFLFPCRRQLVGLSPAAQTARTCDNCICL